MAAVLAPSLSALASHVSLSFSEDSPEFKAFKHGSLGIPRIIFQGKINQVPSGYD